MKNLPKLSKNLQNFAALRAGLLSLQGNKMLANKDHFDTKEIVFFSIDFKVFVVEF